MNRSYPKTTYFHPINAWNSVYSLGVFPISLGMIKFFPQFAGFSFAITLILMMVYFIDLFRLRYHMYILPIGLYITSAMFLQVSAGNTIPPNFIISGLTVLYFFTLDVIVYKQEEFSEFARQISLAGIVMMIFTGYTYIFGLKFIGPYNILSMLYIAIPLNFVSGYWVLRLFGVQKALLLNVVFGIVGLQILWLFRLFPFSHLTLAFFYTTVYFCNIYLVSYYIINKILWKKLLLQVGIVSIMLIAILLTSAMTL